MQEDSFAEEISAAVTAPTRFEKLRGIPWSLAYDVTNTFFLQLTFFGSAFILFLDELNLNRTEIGFLLALFPFFGLLSLFFNRQAARFGYKRTFLTSFGLRTFFAAGLLLLPFMVARFSTDAVLSYVAGITIAFAVSRASAMTALLPWQQEYIPNDVRGKYSANSSVLVSLAGLIAVSIAGYLIDRPLGLARYSLIFGVGIVFGAISVYLAAHIPGGAPDIRRTSIMENGRELLGPLHDRRFVRYMAGLGLVTLATAPVFAFIPLYMQEKVGLNPGSVVFLQTGGLVGGLLSSYFWGWLADRYGSKPVAMSGLSLTATLSLWWYLMPRGTGFSFPVALGIALLQGMAGSGWGIGSGKLLFVSIVPMQNRASYLSEYNALMGLIGGVSSLLGGGLLDALSGLQTQLFGLPIDSFSILFAIGLALPLLSVFILRSIKVEREMGISEFAGLFTHGNPFLAVNSLVRFYFAREEPDVVAVTELLGKSRSPLTINELLNSLHDPRFYVRFEALVSMARHSPDERLISALTEVLDGNDPALSMMAAWALGRVGNRNALPAMRHCLRTSRYRSVRAHVARSLGSLGDRESGPILLDMVRQETDMGLKVAFASALGKLRVIEATPELLEILYDDRYPSSQREMGLSLARLLDAEPAYIRLAQSLPADPGTTLALQVEKLRRPLRHRYPREEELLTEVERAIALFARDELETGLQAFSSAANAFPTDRLPLHHERIFSESASRVQEFGLERMEYVILALLVMEGDLDEDYFA